MYDISIIEYISKNKHCPLCQNKWENNIIYINENPSINSRTWRWNWICC